MSVSGAWRGVRRRPGRAMDATLSITLTEGAWGLLSGMIEETDVDGLADGGPLYMTVDGHRRGEMLIFVATIENAREPQRPIQFIGLTSPGDAEVKGSWILASTEPDRFGTFEMHRIASGVAEAAADYASLTPPPASPATVPTSSP